MGLYFSRKFEETDKEELNDLYNLVANRNRTLDVFEWEWMNSPLGWGAMWLIIDGANEKIIGHHGLIPIPFTCFGSPVVVGKTENTIMHPEYRGQRIYFPFEQQFVVEAAQQFHLNYTISGVAEQGRIRLKLGYKIIGGYQEYYIFSHYKALRSFLRHKISNRFHGSPMAQVLKLFAGVAAPLLNVSFRQKAKVLEGIEIERINSINEVAEEWNAFWQKSKGAYGITVDRTVPFLQWRFFDNPAVNYDFFIARRNGKILGASAVKYDCEGTNAKIEDLVAESNDEMAFNSVLQAIVRHLLRKKISIIRFNSLDSNKSMNNRLIKNGFKNAKLLYRLSNNLGKKRSLMMVKCFDEKLDFDKIYDSNHWYFTDLFGEGVR